MIRPIILFAVLAATGCTSSARFVERRTDGGVVAVSDYKHREDALDLIEQDVGPASIVHEEEVVTGSDVKTRTEVGNGNILHRIGAWFTGTEQVATTDTQTIKATEWRITYTTAPANTMTIPVHEVPTLPRRRFDSHKGTFGKVLIAAGGRGMSGAAVLCGRSALRSGAGLVQVATPACIQPVVAAGNPCYTTFALLQHADGTLADSAAADVATWAASADALAIGPGLGQGADVSRFVRGALNDVTKSAVVVDADALNALAPFTDEYRNRASPLVLTPHPGEFARLTGRSADEVRLQREELAVEFAAKFGIVLLLKGANTLVTDGTRLYRNSTGNPGMATGGSGDVLTGTIAALLAQGLPPFDAAVLGAWIHGRAGDLAAADLGEVGLTAADIVEHLPKALSERSAS